MAKRHSPFGERVAYGTMTFAIASGMLASVVNPMLFSYGYDKLQFVAPVRIGDTIIVEATVAGIRDDPKNSKRGFMDEEVVVRNQGGQVVLVFRHIYSVTRSA